MADELVVLVAGDVIGSVRRERNGRLRFAYEDAYRERPDATPLSASMPLARREHPDEKIRNYMWGLLPDNERVIERWAQEFQVSPRDPFGLLASVGEDCPGAVQFVRPGHVEGATRSGGVDWITEADIATRLRTLRTDESAWRMRHESGRFSLAGAQAKFALFRDGDKWGEPFGRMPTTHIVKPGITAAGDDALNEHLCMAAARNLGLFAAKTELAFFEDQMAIVIERFDRAFRDNTWTRVHQEDVCQALGLPPSSKYQADGGPGISEVAGLLRAVVRPADQSDIAILRFADALAFNWLIGGTDAHAKNYALLYAGRIARLAPLYDIASNLPYGKFDKLTMSMRIGSEYRIKYMDAKRWRDAAQMLGRNVDPDLFLGRIAELSERLPDALADACAGVSGLNSEFPGKLLDVVREAQLRLCPLLVRGEKRTPATRPIGSRQTGKASP
jgi:serine/threonine-protein kinase HipA